MDTPEKKTGYLSIRVPSSLDEDMRNLCKLEHRKIGEMSEVMLKEYMPLKKKVAQPFSIKRDIKIKGTTFHFSPSENGVNLQIITEQPFNSSVISIDSDDKEKVQDLIANLLIFSNTI